MTAATKQAIIEQANRDHAAYPQYRGHWDGPEWTLVTFRKAIRTKLGLAFAKGDVTIARADPHKHDHEFCLRPSHAPYVEAYSTRNRINTVVTLDDIVAD